VRVWVSSIFGLGVVLYETMIPSEPRPTLIMLGLMAVALPAWLAMEETENLSPVLHPLPPVVRETPYTLARERYLETGDLGDLQAMIEKVTLDDWT
jgi:hypothetical protein